LLRSLLTPSAAQETIPAMKRCILMLVLASFFPAQDAQEVEITAEPHHQMVLPNDQVRVFNVDVPPHSETLRHWHSHDYIYVVLGATQIVNAVKGKDPATLALADADVSFVPGTFAHIFRNLSAQPFRNVTIELLGDEKLRQSPAHWNPAHPEEDRGLAIFNGGTKEILFVKDGVRVSESNCSAEPSSPCIITPVRTWWWPLTITRCAATSREKEKGPTSSP
jgi:hypothetical protein